MHTRGLRSYFRMIFRACYCRFLKDDERDRKETNEGCQEARQKPARQQRRTAVIAADQACYSHPYFQVAFSIRLLSFAVLKSALGLLIVCRYYFINPGAVSFHQLHARTSSPS